MIFIYLFLTFFEIGLFGFGGGYGMLSLIQQTPMPFALTSCRLRQVRV